MPLMNFICKECKKPYKGSMLNKPKSGKPRICPNCGHHNNYDRKNDWSMMGLENVRKWRMI